MDLTHCPECAAPAEIQWSAVLDSTDGPVEHAKILCVRRHWFLLPMNTRAHHSTDEHANESAESADANGGEPRDRDDWLPWDLTDEASDWLPWDVT